MTTKLTATLAILSIATVGVQGATFFNEDFSGGTFGPNLASTYGAGNLSVAGGQVFFNGGDDATRGGIGTNDSDYASVDFTATIDITDNDNVFIGMGPGTSTQGGFFGEPATGPTIFMRVGDNFFSDVFLYDGSETQLVAGGAAVLPSLGAGTGALVNSVRMVNSAAADTLEFLYSTDGGMNFTSMGSVDYSATTLGSGTSRIYVAGGNSPGAIGNISIIPEPSFFALLGFGGLAFLLRRRK